MFVELYYAVFMMMVVVAWGAASVDADTAMFVAATSYAGSGCTGSILGVSFFLINACAATGTDSAVKVCSRACDWSSLIVHLVFL